MTRTLDRLPDNVVEALDDWRLWVGVAYFALAAVVVWLAVVATQTAHTSAQTAKEQAIRQATIQADYKACIRSIPNVRRVNRFLSGVNDLGSILIQNSEAAIAAEVPGDPLSKTRAESLRRLRAAQAKITAIRSFPPPTPASCKDARQSAEARG